MTVPLPLTFRRAGPADAVPLAELETACFSPAWSAAELTSHLASASWLAWLAEAGNEPVAYALFLALPGEVELLRVGVPTARRARGLATRLLARACDELVAAGRASVHLEVRPDNVAALALYRRLGFTLAGRRPRYYADGADALLLRRDATARHAPAGG
jgi:ribosomal-protein-alanine N-acetyltransferase